MNVEIKMEQNISGSLFDINNKESALFQKEDKKVRFGWNQNESSEQEILESKEQTRPKWNQFTESTTFHGIKYIFDFNASKFRRALWVCCVLVSVGLFLGQVFARVDYYFNYISNVNAAVVYKKELPFPAVTICNQNNFRLTKTLERGKLVYEFIDKIYSEAEILDVKEFNITDYNDTLSKFDLKEFITTTAHQKFDLIDSCRWKGQACNLSDFKTVYTDLGVCYSFNFNPNETKTTNIAGNRGLSIVMNVEQYEYMRGPQNDAGLKILLHHQNDTPMVKDLGFSVAPGTHTEIGINYIKKISLANPYGDCEHNTVPLTTCMTRCKALTAQRICGCTDLYMEFAEAPTCNMEKAFRCIPYATEIGEGDLGSCQCSSPCDQSLYEHSFSFATLSEFNIERVVLNDPNDNLRVKKKLMNSKEMAVRNIPKYREKDIGQMKDLLDTTSWITGNLTVISNEWTQNQFYLNFKSFDIILMGEDMIKKDEKHDFFTERKILIDCLIQGKVPDTNGDCYKQRNTSLFIKNITSFISKLQNQVLNHYHQSLVIVLEDCFNKFGNFELNISSHSSPNECLSYSSTSSNSSSSPIPYYHTTMNTGTTTTTTTATTTTMSPEQQMSVCRKIVQCKSDSALTLYNQRPEYLDNILDLIRSDINFTKDMILLNTTRLEKDIKKKYDMYEPCLSQVDNLENVIGMYSLVTLAEMVEQFQSLRYGQLEDLLNHTRNMTTFFNYQHLNESFANLTRACMPWVTKSPCSMERETNDDENCELEFPESMISKNVPHYNHVWKRVKRLRDYWTELDPVFDGLNNFLDGTLTKANLTGIFLSPGLSNKLSIKSGLVNDLIDAMKTLKDSLTMTQVELIESYKELFTHKFDWITHNSLEEFALVKYLRENETTGNINERLKSDLDQLDKDNHKTGFESLLTSICHLRKEGLQYYIDFLENTEMLFNSNMENIIENLFKYSEEMEMDGNFFMANFLQVDIFYKELKYQKIEQQVAFSLISLFSEVGGFLGLLLGASVLTVCELLDYIALLAISRMQTIKSTKVTVLENMSQQL